MRPVQRRTRLTGRRGAAAPAPRSLPGASLRASPAQPFVVERSDALDRPLAARPLREVLRPAINEATGIDIGQARARDALAEQMQAQGYTAPEGAENEVVSLDDRIREQIPLGRLGTPADIGEMAVMLASPAGRWITGSIFVVDGGSWLSKI